MSLLRAHCCKIAAGFVALKFNNIVVFSCYISPNVGLASFKSTLENIEFEITKIASDNLIAVCGDFNAKSVSWGSVCSCPRGRYLEEWACANSLVLMNRGNTPTCSRAQGESFVDTTWASVNLVRYICTTGELMRELCLIQITAILNLILVAMNAIVNWLPVA